MKNTEISVIKPEDRTGDGNLLPEAREQALNSIGNYLERMGHLNISDLAAQLHLSRQTTKKLAEQVMKEWHDSRIDQSVAVDKWLSGVIKDINNNPESFGKEKIALISLKLKILERINAPRKASLIKVSKLKSDSVNFALIPIAMRQAEIPIVESLSKESEDQVLKK